MLNVSHTVAKDDSFKTITYIKSGEANVYYAVTNINNRK